MSDSPKREEDVTRSLCQDHSESLRRRVQDDLRVSTSDREGSSLEDRSPDGRGVATIIVVQ